MISWFLPTILTQLSSLISNIPVYAVQIQDQLMMLDIKFNLNLAEIFQSQYNQVLSQLGGSIQHVASSIFSMLGSVVNSFVSIIIIPVALFYFLKDYERVLGGIINSFPRKIQYHVIAIGELLDKSLGSYIRGLFIIMILLSGIATGLLMLVDIKYPLLFGVLIGITDFIPFVGPFLGAIPVILFALTISWKKVVAVLMVIVAIQFIEGNILQPFIIGRNLEMHPLVIMILMIVAGSLFGFYGLLFAIPIFLVAKTLYQYKVTLDQKRQKEQKKDRYFPY